MGTDLGDQHEKEAAKKDKKDEAKKIETMLHKAREKEKKPWLMSQIHLKAA